MTHLLLVEDDDDLAFALVDNLEAESYRVTHETNGRTGLERALAEPFDLILLDIMLPELDGYSVCREIRAQRPDTPILVISAKGQETDKVRGLDLGADDYLPKPFGLAELMARVRALLRRSPATSSATIKIGDAIVDLDKQTVTKDDTEHRLSHHENEVLRRLVACRGEVVSRAELLREIWGAEGRYGDRTVDNHVVKLRRKIEADAKNPQFLLTAYGEGYRLCHG